jgi:hypothetical protein
LGKKILWTSDPGYGSPNDIIHLRHFKRNYWSFNNRWWWWWWWYNHGQVTWWKVNYVRLITFYS